MILLNFICLILCFNNFPYVCSVCNNETSTDTSQRLSRFREVLEKHNIAGYIITDNDDHQSEYVAEHDQRRKFISGFTGSAGNAVVTAKNAALWTDSRYYIQASEQLDCNWELMKTGEAATPKIEEWLANNLPNGSKVAADPKTTSYIDWTTWERNLNNGNLTLVNIEQDLIDEIWGDDEGRPPYPSTNIFVLDIKYAGLSWEEKLRLMRLDMQNSQVDTLVITALDEVAWLLNLRGGDVPFTPVFRSYLVVQANQTIFYTQLEKITDEVRTHLTSEEETVRLKNYEDIWTDLPIIGEAATKVALPSSFSYNAGVSYLIHSKIPKEKILDIPSPAAKRKDWKNEVESLGMREAHIRDAVALCQFLRQLETDIATGNSQGWTELKAAAFLDELRWKQPLSLGPSFETISAYGIHAALPHYQPSNATDIVITNNELYLVDSGGQYFDGTTDVTRTVHFGKPRPIEREVYTKLLMGCIDLVTVTFPRGKTESNLEILLRAPLYSLGLDYGHGSTHGIGSFLSVHEAWDTTYHQSFFGSQEPGYYEENNFGMRLENIVTVVPANVSGEFLTFDTVTLVPYDRKLIEVAMLERKHINWLNAYYGKIREKVGNTMIQQGLQDDYKWLLSQTELFSYTSSFI